MKSSKLFLTLILVFCATYYSYAQNEIIDIDTLSITATKVMPYNKAFTIKVALDADEIDKVFFIKKYKHSNLGNSIEHYLEKSKGYYKPQEIPKSYYYVKKIAEKNYLLLTFADNYMLEPSASYYIIYTQKKPANSALGFFDNFYLSQTAPTEAERATALNGATESLIEFENGMKKVFDTLVFGYYPSLEFKNNPEAFLHSFNTNVLSEYNSYSLAATAYSGSINTNAPAMSKITPNLDSVTFKQLLVDSTINKDALMYLMGKEFSYNNAISDMNTITLQNRIAALLNGSIALDCIFCNGVNVNSSLQSDFTKRIANIESTINLLNNLKRTLFLLHPISNSRSNISASITNIIVWMDYLQASKAGLKGLIKLRKAIETKIIDSFYAGHDFKYASIASGNSYLNFETRNKVLLTPDFGVVSSAITKNGNTLDYGIVPYLGFHINFMAVDKDLPFNSYKKNWKQYFSLMVGWSLVNMEKDSAYSNFFEKSSILTGVGYRINNVIRITAGSQWLFKLGLDASNQQTKTLGALPYLGISFDLNVKQYLNGFVDLLSGIGKTTSTKKSIIQN